MIMKREKEFNKIKLKESEKGITLIALVITIIVLLILAAVSIAMLTGENGILSKASTAKEKHLIAQYEEELNLCIMEMQTDELGTLTMEKLIKKLPQYIQTSQPGEQYEWDTEQTAAEPTGTYKGYEVKVDKNKKAQITGKATGIMISCSVDPSGYTNKNVKATITITCTEGIQSIKQKEPTEEPITANGTECTIVKESIEENTTFKYEVTDLKGNTETKIAQVTNIDKDAPTSCTITANVNDDGAIEVTATAEDAGSGIGKYECYVSGTRNDESNDGTFKIENLASGTYSVYVIAYDKAGNSKKSDPVSDLKVSAVMKDVTAQMVENHPETYYGLKVTNYTSKNGQNDWRIFYSDGEHIFLITGDYIKNDKIDTTKTGMVPLGTYKAYWTKAPSSMQNVSDETKNLFKATGYTLKNGKENCNTISVLLNTLDWEGFKDEGGKAISAIGGSTLEMWILSWNNLYEKLNEGIYWASGSSGYKVSLSKTVSGTEAKLGDKKGHANKLYFSGEKFTDSDGIGCYGYRIASPSNYDSPYSYAINYNTGKIDGNCAGPSRNYGMRPLVALDKEATVDLTD